MKKLISKEKYKERMKVCLTCSSFDPNFNRCKECGCFLLLKAALTITECPLKKWKENESN